jgi:putative IMPACT (imprinted ancient) family translation regulator
MSKHQLFSAQEWQVLQFAVIDVFMMVSQIEGASGMDKAESNAFMDLLEKPESIENMLVRELLASIAQTWKQLLNAYKSQYRFAPAYFEQAFSRVKVLIDSKLSNNEAQDFKVALAFT